MKKKLKLILLSTKNKSSIIETRHGRLINTQSFDDDFTYMNLYAIGDEKPKIGDWSINLNSSHSHKELCRMDNEIELERYVNKDGNDCKKVVITTDKFLVIRYDERYADVIISGKSLNGRLLTFTNDFINTYIERYNKCEIIEYVEVEYENIKQVLSSTPKTTPNGSSYTEVEYEKTEVLKVNPDNTVNVFFNIGLDLNKLEQKLDDILIKETKESLTEWLSSKRNKLYTKDEIKQLLWKGYIKDYKLLLPEKIMDKILPSFEKWIENSLK